MPCGFSSFCPEMEFLNRKSKQKFRKSDRLEAEIRVIRGLLVGGRKFGRKQESVE